MKTTTRSVIRKMWGMKLRMVGISLVIATAMALVISGFYVADVFEYSIDRYFEDNRMPDVIYDLASPVNETQVKATLSLQPDVAVYITRLVAGGVYNYKGEKFPVVIIGTDNPRRKDISILSLQSGDFYTQRNEAVAIKGMESAGLEAGRNISVAVAGTTLNLTITGTVSSPEYMLPSAYGDYSLPIGNTLVVLYMNKTALQGIIGYGVNQIAVILAEGGSTRTVTEALSDYNVLKVTKKEDHPSAVFMGMAVTKMRNMMPVIGSIFMVVGLISIFMTVYRLVQNDSRYIGVMMAMGLDRRDIVRSYLFSGLLLTLIGGIIGTTLGILFSLLIVVATMELYSVTNLYYPLSVMPFLIGWFYSFGIVMISVYIPIRLITRKSVREALAYRPKMRVKTVRLFSRRIDSSTLMGLRNTLRNPTRTFLTIFVVGMTVGVAGSWLVMTDSAKGYIFSMVDGERWDIRGDFLKPVPENGLNESLLGFNPQEAEKIIPFIHMAGEVSEGGKSTGALLIGCNHIETIKKFHLREGEIDSSRAIISYHLSRDLNVRPGDKITFTGGRGEISLEVSAIVDDMVGSSIYTAKTNLVSIFPSELCTGVYVVLGEGKDINAVADAMRYSPAVSKVVIRTSLKDTMNGLLNDAMSLLYTFFLITLVISFVVSSSAVIISTMERDVEFATLNTLGIPRRKVAKSIMVEIGFLALGSVIVGIPLAYVFAKILAVVLAEVLFYFEIYVAIGASVITFLIGFLFVLSSTAVPVRYAFSIDTERVLRERTAG